MSEANELPIYKPKTVADLVLRHQWVNLSDGRICVRELTAADAIMAMERARRSPNDPRGPMDPMASVVYQIALSCFTGEEMTAGRVFSDEQIGSIYLLLKWEFDLLVDTMNELGGMSAAELEETEAFLGARPGSNIFSSRSGASETSEGSLLNSPFRVTA